jgi:hypothetical protein
MKSYYRVTLGKRGVHAETCFEGSFIGVLDETGDVQMHSVEGLEGFTEKIRYIFARKGQPRYHCKIVWTACFGIEIGDGILARDATGNYRFGKVVSGYIHCPGEALGHRRLMKWSPDIILRSAMTDPLKRATALQPTIIPLPEKFHAEIESLVRG